MVENLIDLSDVTFLIPFKKDSDERLRNINVIIKYITKYFKTNIFIMEQDTTRQFVLDALDNDASVIDYEYLYTNNYLMHRTKLLNDMAKKCKTPIISLYDTDVIFTIEQYVNTINSIRNNIFDMIFPYDGRFINYTDPVLKEIIETLSVENINESHGGCYNANSVGGAVFFNKQKFIEFGMENENYMSWGFEDNSRITRAQKLGLRIGRVSGILYHLNHPTSANSSNTQHKAYYDNQYEYQKICQLSVDQLKQYVKTWKWVPK